MADVSLFDASRDQATDNCVSRCEPAHWMDTINVTPLQRLDNTPSTGANTQMNFLLYRSKSEGRTNQLAYVKLYPGNKYKLEMRIARSASDDDSKVERLASFDAPSERGFDIATLASRGLTWHMGHARMVRSGSGGTESQGNIDESLITIESVYLNGKSWDKYNFGHHTMSSMPPLPLFDRVHSRERCDNTYSGSMMPAALEIPVMTGQPLLPPPSGAANQWNFHTPFTAPTYHDGTKEEKKNTFDLPSPTSLTTTASGGAIRSSFLTLPSSSSTTDVITSTTGVETRRSSKRKATAAPVAEASPTPATSSSSSSSDADAPFAFKKNKVGAEFMHGASNGSSSDECPATPTTPSGHSICSTSTTGEVDRMTYGLEEFVLSSMAQQAQEELEAMRRQQQREEMELVARLRQRHQVQEQEFHNRQRRALVQAMLREMGRNDPNLMGMSVAPSAQSHATAQRAFAPVTIDSLLQPDALPSPRGVTSASPRSIAPPTTVRRMVRKVPAPPAVPTPMSTRSSSRAAHTSTSPNSTTTTPGTPVVPVAAPVPVLPTSAPMATPVSSRPSPIAIPFSTPIQHDVIDGVMTPNGSNISGMMAPMTTTPGALIRSLSDEWGNAASQAVAASTSLHYFDGNYPPLADDTLIFV
jgi:hypothetical protein